MSSSTITIGREEDARDVCQETFLRAFRALPGFRGQSAFSTWLYRIAVHTCSHHLRKRRVELTDLQEEFEDDDHEPGRCRLEIDDTKLTAVLEGADLHEQVRTMIDEAVATYVNAATESFPEEWDLDALWTALKTLVDDCAWRIAAGEVDPVEGAWTMWAFSANEDALHVSNATLAVRSLV